MRSSICAQEQLADGCLHVFNSSCHPSGTGKVLFPVFDMLANNMIGDNPALVEELRWVALYAVCCTMHEGWISMPSNALT
jgi:hypothetical protein